MIMNKARIVTVNHVEVNSAYEFVLVFNKRFDDVILCLASSLSRLFATDEKFLLLWSGKLDECNKLRYYLMNCVVRVHDMESNSYHDEKLFQSNPYVCWDDLKPESRLYSKRIEVLTPLDLVLEEINYQIKLRCPNCVTSSDWGTTCVIVENLSNLNPSIKVELMGILVDGYAELCRYDCVETERTLKSWATLNFETSDNTAGLQYTSLFAKKEQDSEIII